MILVRCSCTLHPNRSYELHRAFCVRDLASGTRMDFDSIMLECGGFHPRSGTPVLEINSTGRAPTAQVLACLAYEDLVAQ